MTEQNNDKDPQAIDLGLPSGTLWARCNVGYDPEDAEDPVFYAWGERYMWGETDYGKSHELPDIVGTEYDVAYMEWGGDWQMPTPEQFHELINCCKSEWICTAEKGKARIGGRKFIGPNGNSIYLPAQGYDSSAWRPLGNIGAYWTGVSLCGHPFYLFFDSEKVHTGSDYFDRDDYLAIRPVMNRKRNS